MERKYGSRLCEGGDICGRFRYNNRMRWILFALVWLGILVRPVSAQVVPSISPQPIASESAEVASTSGIVEKKVEEKRDLTQPTIEVKSKLERVLEENPPGELSWYNFLQVAVARAVKNGVPVNTVVLVLLFPLVVAIVTAARHLVGVRGVGILTPALLSVAFLATGIWAGVLLFLVILLVTVVARTALRKLKLQYLPRVSLLLWIVSGGVFVTLLLASTVGFDQLVTVGIFPILILMLLAETFIDIQQGRSGNEARDLILQTFLLAMIASLLLGWELVQTAVLMNPEAIFLGVGVFDIFMGRYTGLRLSEYLMYRGLVRGDEEEE